MTGTMTDTSRLHAEGTEFGWPEPGCSNDPGIVQRQRAALWVMLDKHGVSPSAWKVEPEIRDTHNHGAVLTYVDFGDRLVVDESQCRWAVYGVIA